MSTRDFCIAVLAFATGIVLSYLILNARHTQQQTQQDIIFPIKAFADSGAPSDVVSATGRWTGDGVGYKNNAVNVTCIKGSGECTFYEVDQIGENQIGEVGPPDFLDIKSWNDFEVVASEDNLCARTTINVDRHREYVELVQQPINQSTLACEKADEKTYKWHLDESLYWAAEKAPLKS
jgi:hypothetical protein